MFVWHPALRRFTLVLSALALAGLPAMAAPARPAPAAKPAPAEYDGPWLYKGSDIPPDPAWTFGVLPNGVRYAVRRNGVPPGQVSVRVNIEAGSLNERESERGFAHFMEHLSFRGSRYIADGEAIRTWQRLGATFGSDTNAATTNTQTIYKLDLPGATRSGLDESVKILSGMMMAPEISAKGVETERRTVLAEAREQPGPNVRAGEATRNLFFRGQLLASRAPIGVPETLNAATPESLRAFHDRWYRPERAIVVMVGDGDPAQFASLIQKHFADWKGKGPNPADPDFGKPTRGKPDTSVLIEPGLPLTLSMATLRPWHQKNDTVAYNQGKLIDLVALRLINRRLEERARVGGSFLQAQVDQEDVARSVDGTFVQIVPLGDDWKAALRDVRAVIADALVNPSLQEDIDREAGEFFSALQQAVETQRAEAGSKQADDIIEAVNIRETVASAQVALDVFSGIQNKITPDAILASTKRLFVGEGPRALLLTPTAVPDGEASLAAAIAAPVEALASARDRGAVSFDQLPALGPVGKVKKKKAIEGLDLTQVDFANGVKMTVFPNGGEAGKIYVSVRFGQGFQALPRDRQTPAWAGGAALVAGGVGALDQNALDRLTSGRKIGASFDIAENAFVFRAQTRPADLRDQLRLLAALITSPRWDPAPVLRARASFLAGYDTLDAGPQQVLGRELAVLLRGGDKRWETPSRAEIAALTPESFRRFWEPLLKTGPVELQIFGDVTEDVAIAVAAETFGAIKRRPNGRTIAPTARSVTPNKTPLILTHKGDASQAAAVIAWPTGGGIKDLYESRKLELLSSIFNDRLFNQLRDGEGASYSPNANSQWPTGIDGGGNFVVASQLQPDGTDVFFRVARSIAADLAAKPVSADELDRAVRPLQELITRIATGNNFWLSQTAGGTRDPRRYAAVRSLSKDFGRITPEELQRAAQRWFIPNRTFSAIARAGSR